MIGAVAADLTVAITGSPPVETAQTPFKIGLEKG